VCYITATFLKLVTLFFFPVLSRVLVFYFYLILFNFEFILFYFDFILFYFEFILFNVDLILNLFYFILFILFLSWFERGLGFFLLYSFRNTIWKNDSGINCVNVAEIGSQIIPEKKDENGKEGN
jgi:hypothetical protein